MERTPFHYYYYYFTFLFMYNLLIVLQMLQPLDATRKTLKWYGKVAIHLLQVALLNSFILYQKEKDPQIRFAKFVKEVSLHFYA